MHSLALILTATFAVSFAQAGEKVTAKLVKENVDLMAPLPKEALAGAGVWSAAGYIFVTGHSKAVDIFAGSKKNRTEREIAELDAKQRLMKFLAKEEFPDFESDFYDIEGTFSGEQTAAVYHIPREEGIFLTLAFAPENVDLRVVFNPEKTRKRAEALFEAEEWNKAGSVLALLTQKGVQDPKTVGLAQAASAHVNLEAGVTGKHRESAFEVLGGFYFSRNEWEKSLRYFFDLYSLLPEPGAELLMRLADLSEKTGRPNNAAAFKKEAKLR